MPARRGRNVRGGRRRRRPNREQPKRYFVGVEGQSEQALVRWIESLCLNADRKVWFDVRIAGAGGGSTRAVVEHSLNNRNRSQRGPYAKTLIFLDEDRRVQDGPDAEVIARREGNPFGLAALAPADHTTEPRQSDYFWYGIFNVAEYSLLLGVGLREPLPEIGSCRDVLKKCGLVGHA